MSSIGDESIVVPRNNYGYWQTMDPANGVADVEYCTTHLRSSDAFNGGSNLIGLDIIEGLFLVFDWDNYQVGFGNSTAKSIDPDFTIPDAVLNAGNCSYTTPVGTIDPYITTCTEDAFGGTCQQIKAAYPGCTALNS